MQQFYFIHTKKLYRTRKGKKFQRNCHFSFSFKSFKLFESNVLSHSLHSRFATGHLTSPIMPVGIAVKSGPEYWPITARVIHLIEKRCCVKSIHYTMNDTTQRFSGKRENLILFSGTVKIILTRDTQIYSKTFLGMKIS